MKIRTQLIFTLSLFGLILVGMATSLLLTNRQVNQLRQQEEIALRIERGADELSSLTGDYLMYGESQQRTRWEASFASFSEDVSRLDPANPEQRAIVDHIKADQNRLHAVFADVVSTMVYSDQASESIPGLAFKQVSWSRMEVQIRSIAFESYRLSQQLRDRADQVKQRNSVLIFILISIFGIYLFINYYLIYRGALKSIAELQAGTAKVGSGDLDFTIVVKRADEIGELSIAFNRMTSELKEVTSSKADLEREISERRQAEAALVASERKYRELLETANSIIIRWDHQGVIRFVNEYGLRFFGYSAEELIGRKVMTIVPEVESSTGRDLDVLVKEIVLQPEQYTSAPSENITKDGRTVWVAWTNKAILDEQGNVREILAIGNDITSLKAVEAALRESEGKYRSLFSNMNEGFGLHEIILDADGKPCDYRFLELNAAFEELTGISREIAIGKTVKELMPSIDPYWIETYGRVAQTGEPVRFENYSTPLKKWYEIYCYSPGKNRFAVVFIDVTERKQMEERLTAHTNELQEANKELQNARRAALNLVEDALIAQEQVKQVNLKLGESEKRLNRAQEIAHLGSWELDLVKDKLTWSDEAYRIFGLQPQEFDATYEAFLEAVHPDDRAAVDEAYSRSIREGQDRYEIEHRIIKHSNGEICIVHEKCEHFRNDAGKIVRSVGMVHDVTDRKRAEAALQESESKYRNLFENMTEEVHFWQLVRDEAGHIQTWRLVDANPPTLNTWGRTTVDEIRGKTTDEIFGPGASEHFMPVIQKIMTEGIPYSYEDYFPNLDKFFRFTSVPLGDYFITTGADITIVKKAEQELRASRDELELRVQRRTEELARAAQEWQTTFDSSSDAIWILGQDQRILRSNKAAEQLFGHACGEMIGQKCFEIAHATDEPIPQCPIRMARESLRRESIELQLGEGWFQTAVHPIFDRDNQQAGWLHIVTDITERKVVEEKIDLERKKLKSILDTMSDGVYIVNQSYDIEYINPAIEKEYGEIGERKCYRYLHGLDKVCPWCVIREVVRGKVIKSEWTSPTSGKVFELTDTPIRQSDGYVSKLGIRHDISQLKENENQLKQVNLELMLATQAEYNQRQLAEALVDAALVLNKSLNLEEVLPLIIEKIEEAIPYELAAITLLEGDSFYDASRKGDLDSPAIQTRMQERYLLEDFPLLLKIHQSGQPLLIQDTQLEPDWVHVNGFEWCRSFLSAPLVVEEQVTGFVNLFARQAGFFTPEMRDRLAAFASHAAVAIQNAWLVERIRTSSDRLQSLSHRLVSIQENERQLIARELHDEAGQMLTSMKLDLHLLLKNASQPDLVIKKVVEMEDSVDEIQENLHRLAAALRPASLDHLGLVAAIRQHVESIGEKQGIKVSFKSGEFGKRLPPNVETALYRIVQEALTNIVRHAHATQVDVLLTARDGKLVMIIEDNGIGFNPDHLPASEHLGLFGMRERAEMIGGNLVIESVPGFGTTVVVEVDIDDPMHQTGP